MLSLMLYLVCWALVLGLFWWVVTLLPLPPPVPTILMVGIAVIFVVVLVNLIGGISMDPAAMRVLR